jgi:low temperature requirement protein LtrA
MARDAYSLLHFPMVAGVVLVAFGLKKVLAHVDEPLDLVPAAALVGGAGVYLLSHVSVRLCTVGTLNRQRLLLGVVLLALVPLAREVDAVVALGGVAALIWAMVAYEAIRFADARSAVRHGGSDLPPS